MATRLRQTDWAAAAAALPSARELAQYYMTVQIE